MQKISDEIIHFFRSLSFTVVSTIDKVGRPHNSCKGIVEIKPEGKVYLLDLYKLVTYENLKRNPAISITGINENSFQGYCLKGKATIIQASALSQEIIKAWEDKITSRITQRVIKNIVGEKGHSSHPEALLPKPAYLILVEVEEIVNLTPQHLVGGT